MQIIFKKSFEKQLKKLGVKIKDKFKERLKIFFQDKYNEILNFHKLKGELTQFYSINITGDIRVIFKIIDEEKIVFYMIGTHSELYK